MPQNVVLGFQFRNQRYNDAQTGLRAFASFLERSPERATPALRKELTNYLDTVAHALSTRHGNSWPSGTTSMSLSRRSGEAVRSIKKSVRVTGNSLNSMKGTIGGVHYLKTHEYGATIRPRKAKYLTIPIPEFALNPNGTPKKKSAREWKNTFVARSKKGNLLIFQKRGRKVVPLYVLKTQVRIPPRLKMGETLRSQMPYFVDKATDEMVREIRGGKV